MWLYFIHQGIGIEVIIMLIPFVILKSLIKFTIVLAIPLIVLILIKMYLWFIMISIYKIEKNIEQKVNFGKQWILNSLLIMQPSVRLTIPREEENEPTLPISVSYEQFR